MVEDLVLTLSAANACLERYLREPDPEELHSFRVEMKRARACAWLLERAGARGRILRSLEPWIRLYRRSGAVRDLDVHHGIMLDREPDRPGKGKWESRVRQAHVDFHSRIKASSARRLKSLERITARTFRVRDEKLMATYRKAWRRLLRKLQEDDPGSWHGQRKRIKRMAYLCRLMQHHGTHAPLLPATILNFMDDLQNRIGKWHDAEGLVQALHQSNDASPVNPSAGPISSYRDRLAESVREEIAAFRVLATPVIIP